MAKYTNHKKMSKRQQENLFIRFAKTLASIKSPVEAAHFLKDLFSEQEVIMVARRLEIADLLEAGCTYEQIRKSLNVSDPTIAKMQAWLALYGEEFGKIIKRTRTKEKSDEPNDLWRKHKRKYAMYYWPELILQEIVKGAGKREKERLLKVVSQLKEKTALTQNLLILLNSNKT